jgi:hypothetical protein
MSLFPEENISTREIESWKGFADGIKSEEDKKLFLEMLQKLVGPRLDYFHLGLLIIEECASPCYA